MERVEDPIEGLLRMEERAVELGNRKVEGEFNVLVRLRDREFVDRLGVEGRRILFDIEERVRLDGGLMRTVGLVFLRTGVLIEG